MEIQLEDDPHIVDSVISSQLPTYLSCGHHLAELITPLYKHLIHLDSRPSHYPDVPPTSLICSSLYLLCLHPLLSHFFTLDGSLEPSVLGALPYSHSWPFIWFHAFKYCLRILWQLLYKILLQSTKNEILERVCKEGGQRNLFTSILLSSHLGPLWQIKRKTTRCLLTCISHIFM